MLSVPYRLILNGLLKMVKCCMNPKSRLPCLKDFGDVPKEFVSRPHEEAIAFVTDVRYTQAVAPRPGLYSRNEWQILCSVRIEMW